MINRIIGRTGSVASVVALLVLAATGVLAQDAQSTRLLRQPDISRTSVVFVYAGDLWTVPRSGGLARRLTANPSIKRYPKYSPDGKLIAFTGNYDGNNDVYVIPADGGEPKRLTYHPGPDDVSGWTPDGSAILFRSSRTSVEPRASKLFTVPVGGGPETELPLPEATTGSFSPDATKIAYNRIERELAPWKWKRYRGGAQAYVSIYDLKNNVYSELPHTDVTDLTPMWHKDAKGERIYFVSDRTNTSNLFSYDVRSKAVKQHTRYNDYDIKWPSVGPDGVVFERGGTVNIFDFEAEKVTPVNIIVKSDMTAARSFIRNVDDSITGFGISPSGSRAVFEAYGEIFTAPAKKGDVRNLTNSPGVREMNPVWSPDGRSIAYLSDRSGEYEIYVRPQDGGGTETRVTSDGGVFRYGPLWSPDSKSLLYTDAAMRMWIVGVEQKTPVLVDKDAVAPISLGTWSPDSKWIAYTKTRPNQQRSIYLYSVDQKRSAELGDGRWDDRAPAFDLNGKYLYFVSDRTFNPSIVGPEININFENTTQILAYLLAKDTPSPFGIESDEEKPAPAPGAAPAGPPTGGPSGPPAGGAPPAAKPGPAPIKVDLDGIAKRVVTLPIAAGSYGGLNAGTNKLLYMSGPALHQFDMTSRADTTLISGVAAIDLNPAANKLMYMLPGPAPGAPPVFGIVDVSPGIAPGAGRLTFTLDMVADPRAEWTQMFNDTWRYERDFFYDPNMKGLDWKALRERYGKLVGDVSHRDDLTYLLIEMISELSTSHLFVSPPAPPRTTQVPVGLLGADFEPAGGYYRIKKIYAGESWNPGRRAPLAEPGVNVKEGDYLIAVNGKTLRTDTNPFLPFQATVGKIVTLKVNDRPTEDGAREVQVRPIPNDNSLRYLDWVESNRRKVEAATGGRIGYVHVPDTQTAGITEFGKGFYSQLDKDGFIVDERYNGGGYIPDFFVEKLGRKRLSMITRRWGADVSYPTGAVYGPKAMLVNEFAGSGGDALPDFFRRAAVGPIIGKRTAGGLVGISGSFRLLDGGSVTAPSFGLWSAEDKKWIAENIGTVPDIEVSNTPDLVRQGKDPQLERAIAYVMDQLKKNPPVKPVHPPFPVEHLNPAGATGGR